MNKQKLVCRNCGKEILRDNYNELYHAGTSKYLCSPKDLPNPKIVKVAE